MKRFIFLESGLFKASQNLSEVITTNASRTLDSSDINNFLLCENTANIILTIPNNVNIPVNSEINITQDSTGKVTISPESGVSLSGDGRSNQSFTLLNQYALATLKKVSSTSWRIYGALEW
ncbi:MAG: hypothetical protein AAF316_00130 [Cyanobacteria bacterium P01_A01_bin.80]